LVRAALENMATRQAVCALLVSSLTDAGSAGGALRRSLRELLVPRQTVVFFNRFACDFSESAAFSPQNAIAREH